MKVTNTRMETIMYDTNGKKVSIVREEIIELDSQPNLLTREEGEVVREKVTIYKENLTNAKKIKTQLEKLKGSKEGRRVFNSMADLIMVVETPVKLVFDIETNSTPNFKKTREPSEDSWLHKAAYIRDSFFNEGPSKKKKK